MIEFQAWPKVARLNRDIIITEKIDGTNAAVTITEDGDFAAQSRTRIITPQDDNFGFAQWAYDHAEKLTKILGPGTHFGEWWGSGIQRGYGLPKGEKRFSLFNFTRWEDVLVPWADHDECGGLRRVPLLYQGPFDRDEITKALRLLKYEGSEAAEGFFPAEGIVIYHTAARTMFKVTLEGDDRGKEWAA